MRSSRQDISTGDPVPTMPPGRNQSGGFSPPRCTPISRWKTISSGVMLAATVASGMGAATSSPTATAGRPPTVTRFKENPIIRPEMLPGQDGANICFPSLIRTPGWLKNPLGKYYLYFADHKGSHVRLAYADRIEGPWRIHNPGTLKLEQMVAVARAAEGANAAGVKGNHIGSPDVHVDNQRQEIRMYFHFQIAPNATWGHRSGVAVSKDGLAFQVVGAKPIGEPYFRVFRWDGVYYAINRSAALARSRDGLTDFEVGNRDFAAAVGHKTLAPGPVATSGDARQKRDGEDSGDGIRHTAIKIDGNVLTVFYSRAGDVPETILCSTVELTGDWRKWRLSPPMPVLAPAMEYEGANVPPRSPTNPEMRVLPRPMFKELRDPCIYREHGITYLLYAIAGERGIAGGILHDH